MKGLALALAALFATTALLASGESATAQRQLKVGYVVFAGATPNRNDLFGLPYDAFIRAVKALGVEGRVLQVAPNQDPAPRARSTAASNRSRSSVPSWTRIR